MKIIRNTKSRKARNALRALAVALSALTALSTTTYGQQAWIASAEQYVAAPDSDKTKFLLALIKDGQHEAASKLLNDYPLQGEFSQNRILFIEGMILKSRGDLTSAAKKFRAALANDPSLTLVRAELAKTLVVLDQDDSAKHHLALLAAEAPNQEQASAIKSFIDQVDAKRPFVMNGYVAAAPSSNLNNASRHEKIYLPFAGEQVGYSTAQKESGVGLAFGGNGAFSKRLGNKIVGVLAGGVNAKLYQDDDFNQISTSQSAELRYLTDTGYMGLGLVGSQSFGTDSIEPGYTAFGPRASFTHAFSPKDHLNTSVVYEWRNYENDMQDGNALLTDVSWTHAFDSTFNITAISSFNIVTADEKSFGYKTVSVGMGAYKELTAGITLNTQVSYAATKFDEQHSFLFPYVRQDDRITGSIGVTKRDFELLGLAPSINYTYSHNMSNVDLYDFDTHNVDIRLTKKF